MLGRLYRWLDAKERSLRQSMGRDISTPEARREAWRHYLWFDHGVLRFWWRNFAEVAPGVYRSNHPHHARFANYAGLGIKSVLNLRGVQQQSFYLFEEESCAHLGMTLRTVHLSARAAPKQERLLALLDELDTITKPVLIHCKSGADRTGLAAAFYLLMYTDADDDAVRAELSFRYLHIRKSKTGILDHILETYLTARDASGISVRDWVVQSYDQEAITAAYRAKKAKEQLWQGWGRPARLS